MSTQPRIIIPHAYYQIRSEIIPELVLFPSLKEKRYFFSRLDALAKAAHFKIISKTVHPDHYHLVVKTSEATVSWFMRTFNSSIAKHLNKHYRRKGKVFSRRFSSAILEKSHGLEEVACHVHQNCMRAKAYSPPDPERWKLDYSEHLVRKKYSADYPQIIEQVRYANECGHQYPHPSVCVIGTYAFVQKVLESHGLRLTRMKLNLMRNPSADLEALEEKLKTLAPFREGKVSRSLFVLMGVLKLEYSCADLARYMGVSRSTVSRMVSRKTGSPRRIAELRKTRWNLEGVVKAVAET
ncbi:MAG: transposase [Chitinispirillaceae bacterium]